MSYAVAIPGVVGRQVQNFRQLADENRRFHPPARQWLEDTLRGTERVGLPWQSLGAFLRLSTNPRVYPRPLAPEVACAGWRVPETTCERFTRRWNPSSGETGAF